MNDELEREREERLLKFAALAGQEQEDKEYEAFLRSDEYVPPDEAWMKKVTGELRRPARHRPVHWRKLVVMAASIIVLLCAGVGTAIANPKALANLFSQDYERYSQVRVDDGVVLEKPEGWESEYYPTWAPEGFHIEDINIFDDTNSIKLTNHDGTKVITFSIGAENNFSNTENLEPIEITIAGENLTAFTSTDNTRKLIKIAANDGTIVIDGQLTLRELENMVENIENLR